MQSLQFFLSIGLVLYSIYSVIVYLGRRSENKNTLRQLRDSNQGFRHLSPEEQACLLPFLVDPLKPGKSVELQGDEVYKIAGEFVRHGLHVSNGGDTMHDTLADIDVVLPYDARNFLEAVNTAEVVLTPKFAIVIRLNDTFDLMGGRERAQLEQAQQQQWNAGQTGELPRQSAPDETAPADPDAEPDIGRVNILAQREETAAEAAARAHPGWGWLPAMALTPAFVLLMVAGNSDEFWPWLAPSLLFFALALWLIWRPRNPPARQKINRVQGTLAVISLQSPGNSSVVRSQLFLGDKFPIVMPEHWKAQATVPPDSQVTLEMRVEDYSVVRFGKKLSIDTEEQKFPSIYWGRHLTLMLTGLAMLLAGWLFNDQIRADLAHARAGILTSEEQTLEQASALIAQPPAPGSIVHLRAQVRCQIAAPVDNNPPPIDCSRVRWGGDDLHVEAVEPEADVLALYRGDVLQARRNPLLDMMIQMRMAQDADPLRRLMGTPSLLIISNLSQLILTIDQECKLEGVSNRPACARLQQTISEKLAIGEEDKKPGWGELLRQAGDGSLKKEDDAAVASAETVRDLQQELRDVAAARMRKTFDQALQTLIDSQRGGILLPLDATQASRLQSPAANQEATEATTPDGDPHDWLAQWAAYQELAKPESLKSLEMSGLVVSSGKTAHGDALIEIDSQRTRDNYLPAALRLLALLAGAIFLVTHGLLWIINLRRAMQRSRAIEEYYRVKYG